MYSKEQFTKMMDYTLLKPTATRDDVVRFCDEAKKYHFAAVVVFPFWVPLAARELAGSDIKVATVIGFPFGANTRSTKLYESRNAVTNGAKELDIVINISAVKSGEYGVVERELSELIDTTRMAGMTEDAKRTLIKVIIEAGYLTNDEKVEVCKIIRDSGADFVKTSTGTAPIGATVEDIRIIRGVVGATMGVKAAGGIKTADQAMAMLDAGASRIGTSSAVYIAESYVPENYLEKAERRR